MLAGSVGRVVTGAGAGGWARIWSGRVALLTRRLSVSKELEDRPSEILLLGGSSCLRGSTC